MLLKRLRSIRLRWTRWSFLLVGLAGVVVIGAAFGIGFLVRRPKPAEPTTTTTTTAPPRAATTVSLMFYAVPFDKTRQKRAVDRLLAIFAEGGGQPNCTEDTLFSALADWKPQLDARTMDIRLLAYTDSLIAQLKPSDSYDQLAVKIQSLYEQNADFSGFPNQTRALGALDEQSGMFAAESGSEQMLMLMAPEKTAYKTEADMNADIAAAGAILDKLSSRLTRTIVVGITLSDDEMALYDPPGPVVHFHHHADNFNKHEHSQHNDAVNFHVNDNAADFHEHNDSPDNPNGAADEHEHAPNELINRQLNGSSRADNRARGADQREHDRHDSDRIHFDGQLQFDFNSPADFHEHAIVDERSCNEHEHSADDHAIRRADNRAAGRDDARTNKHLAHSDGRTLFFPEFVVHEHVPSCADNHANSRAVQRRANDRRRDERHFHPVNEHSLNDNNRLHPNGNIREQLFFIDDPRAHNASPTQQRSQPTSQSTTAFESTTQEETTESSSSSTSTPSTSTTTLHTSTSTLIPTETSEGSSSTVQPSTASTTPFVPTTTFEPTTSETEEPATEQPVSERVVLAFYNGPLAFETRYRRHRRSIEERPQEADLKTVIQGWSDRFDGGLELVLKPYGNVPGAASSARSVDEALAAVKDAFEHPPAMKGLNPSQASAARLVIDEAAAPDELRFRGPRPEAYRSDGDFERDTAELNRLFEQQGLLREIMV
ncbi:hypothetical protein M3Y99_00475100 [Aphelenchoides fujianensis]|nr:hypothetical protein M3Y99_00475100 [Aphelenchoides fujianensis]